jgi:hypothetical protein
MSADVACPRCPAGPFTEPGRLAGHLVEVHGQSAAVALHDARRLLAPIAAALGKPVATIVSDLKPDPKEAKMAKKKRAQQKCRICTKPGHNAKSCTEKPAARGPINKAGQPRGSMAEIAARSSNGAGVDLVAKAKADARALIKSKIDDELVMARAYLAELERLANA